MFWNLHVKCYDLMGYIVQERTLFKTFTVPVSPYLTFWPLSLLSSRFSFSVPACLPPRERRADAEGCPVLHVVLPGQGADQRCAAVWGADGGARLQYTSHHASIPTIHSRSSKAHRDLPAWKVCLLCEEGRAGLRRFVISPGHVVMAGAGAVIAREGRKEICGNNKLTEIPSEPAEPCRSHSVSTAGFS